MRSSLRAPLGLFGGNQKGSPPFLTQTQTSLFLMYEMFKTTHAAGPNPKTTAKASLSNRTAGSDAPRSAGGPDPAVTCSGSGSSSSSFGELPSSECLGERGGKGGLHGLTS